jgi:leader peptidase (prepilin peptidase) / N-methyltransferase
MTVVTLIVAGLIFGSFVNALVWRVYQQSIPKKKQKKHDLSIIHGRSQCTQCGHVLSQIDLIPVFSWLSLRGKCRYCHQAISWQYPCVEVMTSVLFVLSYIYWPYELSTVGSIQFVAWLIMLIGLVALLVYDVRWMLLPNRILFPLYGVALVYVLLSVASVQSISPLFDAVLGVLVGGGIFYVLFTVSNGRWIGGGDVKLGFLLGALAGGPVLAGLLLFLASFLGTMLILPFMMIGRLSKASRIPFGPFLIVSGVIVVLFGQRILDWYTKSVLGIY